MEIETAIKSLKSRTVKKTKGLLYWKKRRKKRQRQKKKYENEEKKCM